jgi:hypothetical protein
MKSVTAGNPIPGNEPSRQSQDDEGHAEMAAWYRELDLLPGGTERIVSAETSLDDTAQLIMVEAGFASESTGTPPDRYCFECITHTA